MAHRPVRHRGPTAVDTLNPKAGLGVLGVGAAACAACCAGPIVGFLAATGSASALGAVAFGAAGLLIVLAVGAVLWHRRRRRARACATTTSGPVALDAPHVRTGVSEGAGHTES